MQGLVIDSFAGGGGASLGYAVTVSSEVAFKGLTG